jgi:hypothetical protein
MDGKEQGKPILEANTLILWFDSGPSHRQAFHLLQQKD